MTLSRCYKSNPRLWMMQIVNICYLLTSLSEFFQSSLQKGASWRKKITEGLLNWSVASFPNKNYNNLVKRTNLFDKLNWEMPSYLKCWKQWYPILKIYWKIKVLQFYYWHVWRWLQVCFLTLCSFCCIAISGELLNHENTHQFWFSGCILSLMRFPHQVFCE